MKSRVYRSPCCKDTIQEGRSHLQIFPLSDEIREIKTFDLVKHKRYRSMNLDFRTHTRADEAVVKDFGTHLHLTADSSSSNISRNVLASFLFPVVLVFSLPSKILKFLIQN